MFRTLNLEHPSTCGSLGRGLSMQHIFEELTVTQSLNKITIGIHQVG